MKLDKGLKIALIILLIILISIISFVGLYIQEKKSMVNMVEDYKLGMDLTGSRSVTIAVDNSNKTVYYDKEGKEVKEETEDGTKEEVPVNSQEILTKDNYLKTKEIIEKRLNELKVSEYSIRQDAKTGKLTILIPEDSTTDLALQYIYTAGKFTVVDEENNVLFDNSNIESVKVAYSTTQEGTIVFLNIQFKEDSIDKLKEVTNAHLKTTDEEGKDNSKKITLKIDDSELTSISFEEQITNGVLSLSVGDATTNSETINTYLKEASNIAILLDNGNFPITYTLEQNRYVLSDITTRTLVIAGLTSGIVFLVLSILLSIIYKKKGILVGIANIGYVAVLLIIIRYTNVILTTEGFFGIAISMILSYVFSIYLLKEIKETEKEQINVRKAYNKTIIAMLLILVPALVVGITLCFTNWMPIYSFGEIIFWGILTMFIYHTVLTRTLLIYSTEK